MARRILFVAFDECQALDLVGPLEVFVGATQIVQDCYRVAVATPGRRPIQTSSGLRIEADLDLLRTRSTNDTVVVVGGAGTRAAAGDRRMLAAIERVTSGARRVASVCTGAFLLAAAGLLSGRRATTHWAYCERFAKLFPDIDVHPDAIFVRDGNVWTSAGVTAGMDLALALLEEDVGRDVALTVARHLVLFVRRPGGQSQFSVQLAGQVAARDELRELQVWISENAADDLRVPVLAGRVGMSARNFARVFRAEVGMPPGQFVERARIENARRLLETTRLSQGDVATACGFATTDVFRRAFIRQLGVTPGAYRARFSEQENEQWTS